jgi:N6-adenosine-specific RNA methylase IME4
MSADLVKQADAEVPAELTEASALALLDQAETALSHVETAGEAEDVWRKVATIAEAARRFRLSKVVAVAMSRTKLRAERKWGAMLIKEPVEVKPGPGRGNTKPVAESDAFSKAERDERSRARKLAKVPETVFDEYVESGRAESAATREVIGDDVLTRAGVFHLHNVYLREERRDERRERSDALANVDTPALLDEYQVLCADPPWQYDANATPDLRSIENHYPTLTVADLCELEVPAAEDAVMFMWATSPKLTDALHLLDAWDFHYRTCMVWVKDRIGMGYYARQQHELLLIGRRGDLEVPDPSDRPSSVIQAARTEHSAKPQEAYDAIARMYPHLPRLEMFARGPRKGWAVWGNEAEVAA